METAPVLFVTKIVPAAPTLGQEVDTWEVFCPHCRRNHTHSAGEGHRVAHCLNSTSPYVETGYVLRLPASFAGW